MGYTMSVGRHQEQSPSDSHTDYFNGPAPLQQDQHLWWTSSSTGFSSITM